ncbi:hypothetical protein [Aminobacter carboxidus]|uniref:Uncharacterized protein n=1 Tax=Aminobacter carboxidus TaxID=376165 RepID=A0ABR9GN16_9HYPH|nr:hypothetical protein [Aminobacter carboxidus]MBE1205077.1 hypothetical protein [Aminobacter carboxidus]
MATTISRDSSKNFVPGGKCRSAGALNLFARAAGAFRGLDAAVFVFGALALAAAGFLAAGAVTIFAFVEDALAAVFLATGADTVFAFTAVALVATGFFAAAAKAGAAFLAVPAGVFEFDFGAAFLAMMLVLRGSEFISLWAGRRPAARCRNSR